MKYGFGAYTRTIIVECLIYDSERARFQHTSSDFTVYHSYCLPLRRLCACTAWMVRRQRQRLPACGCRRMQKAARDCSTVCGLTTRATLHTRPIDGRIPDRRIRVPFIRQTSGKLPTPASRPNRSQRFRRVSGLGRERCDVRRTATCTVSLLRPQPAVVDPLFGSRVVSSIWLLWRAAETSFAMPQERRVSEVRHLFFAFPR